MLLWSAKDPGSNEPAADGGGGRELTGASKQSGLSNADSGDTSNLSPTLVPAMGYQVS